MSVRKSNTAKLRSKAASRGILTIKELARRVPCSRVAIYLSLEKPNRFPRVTRRVRELTEA